MTTRFSKQAEQLLRRAGWHPGRRASELVSLWKASPALSDSFEMFESAEQILLEFGGLSVNQRGPGQTCAREPFTLDPTLAAYEIDRFTQFSTLLKTRLYPLGEAAGGYYFLAVGENNRIYLMMEDIKLLGETIDEALEKLLIGIRPTEIE